MADILFKNVNYLNSLVKIPIEFEGVLRLRFTDSDYKIYCSSFLICSYPQLHVIKKFRKGLTLCFVPVYSSNLSRKFNLYRICYVQA